MYVSKTANDLDKGIKNMMEAAKADYARWTTNAHGEQSAWARDSIAEWYSKIRVMNGKKYIKVVKENGVFAFIVKEDFKYFKKGDILMPASWRAPALNRPRGNVLKGDYQIRWTGPLYLK